MDPIRVTRELRPQGTLEVLKFIPRDDQITCLPESRPEVRELMRIIANYQLQSAVVCFVR